jgi:2,3-bisphosphoglycerate-dependent phosphoglycerate mutase
MFTSALKRAQLTGQIMLDELNNSDLLTVKDQNLNERAYGDLTGMNKDDARKEFGEEQVHIWRRSYDTSPPGGESLKDTYDRAVPYFERSVIPALEDSKNVLVAAHGNSLRAIVKYIENISETDIVKLEIATGDPIIYSYSNGTYTRN